MATATSNIKLHPIDLAEPLAELQAAFIGRAGHPLLATGRAPPFAALLAYPIATTPLSDEVARLLVEKVRLSQS